MHAGKAAAKMDGIARSAGQMGMIVVGVRMVVVMIMFVGTFAMVAMVAVAMAAMRVRMGMCNGMRMAVSVAVVVVLTMVVVIMIVAVRRIRCAGFEGGLRAAAAADCTHQATSNSLRRISSPPVICS
jgi:hypothetical protein